MGATQIGLCYQSVLVAPKCTRKELEMSVFTRLRMDPCDGLICSSSTDYVHIRTQTPFNAFPRTNVRLWECSALRQLSSTDLHQDASLSCCCVLELLLRLFCLTRVEHIRQSNRSAIRNCCLRWWCNVLVLVHYYLMPLSVCTLHTLVGVPLNQPYPLYVGVLNCLISC